MNVTFNVWGEMESEQGERRILDILAKANRARKAKAAAENSAARVREWFRGIYAKSIAERGLNALNRSAEAARIAVECARRGDHHAANVWEHAALSRQDICNRLQAKAPVYASGGRL